MNKDFFWGGGAPGDDPAAVHFTQYLLGEVQFQ